MSTYNEPRRPLEFLSWEAHHQLCREEGTLAASQGDLLPGTVVAKINSGEHTAVGVATTVGNGDFVAASVSASAGAKAGVYKLICVSATKAGLYDPSGNYLGLYTIGDAYSAGGLAFDTEGTWAAGDTADITVTIAAGTQFVVYANAATNGAGEAYGVLAYAAPNSTSTQKITVIERMATMDAPLISWGSNNDAGIAAGRADLLAKNIRLIGVDPPGYEA